ncbi:MAG: prolipoprotein diacylglyceryl transferase, partial [Chloroflexi bacterium]|nr:prolipoprotein diacylglyceryl transferase [Chloroflexota bacterium]
QQSMERGGFVGAIIYVWKSHLPMGRFFDAGAPATILGLAVGRLGCLINGDAWGAPTGGNWGLVYTNPAARLPASLLNVPTQPFPIYELILDVGIFFVLSWLRDTGRIKANGAVTLLTFLSYSVVRFFLTYFRQERIIFMGLQQAQLIAVICAATMVPALVFIFVHARLRGERPTEVATAPIADQAAGTD